MWKAKAVIRLSDFWKGFRLVRPEDNEVYCIAYGSNLDEARMKKRCPGAEVFGTSVIGGYRLLFKQSMTGAYATIEQDANCCVPVVIYRISAEDELKLDRFEGYPKYYYKQEFLLPVWGLNGRKKKLRRSCIAYILHEYRLLGEPGEEYFDLLDRGYERWSFDKAILRKAVEDSIGRDAAGQWLAEYYGEEEETNE